MPKELENVAIRELTADELLTVSGGWEAAGNFGIAVHFAALVNYMVEKKGLEKPFDWVGTQEPER